jgi:hypothetical protein
MATFEETSAQGPTSYGSIQPARIDLCKTTLYLFTIGFAEEALLCPSIHTHESNHEWSLPFLFFIHRPVRNRHPRSRKNKAKPYFDQSTYLGRVRHFIQVTSPLNLFVTGSGLEDAKNLISNYNAGKIPATTDPAKLWRAKESKFNQNCWFVVFCPSILTQVVGFNWSESTVGKTGKDKSPLQRIKYSPPNNGLEWSRGGTLFLSPQSSAMCHAMSIARSKDTNLNPCYDF